MAITVTEVAVFHGAQRPSSEPKSLVWATVLFDSGYPAGGEALAETDFDSIGGIDSVIVGGTLGDATVQAYWDQANSKLGLYEEDATSGISVDFATTDASAITATILVVGEPAVDA